jgi:hypothetical protein
MAELPYRPALHGLIDQLPRRWPNEEVKASWLHAFGLVLDYTVPMSKPKSSTEDNDDDGNNADRSSDDDQQ